MKSVLFDTNIILDIALKRAAYFDTAQKLFELIDSKQINACVTATTITDIYFISRKNIGREKAIEFIAHLIEVVEIAGVDREVMMNALKLELKDFEDAVQISATILNDIECIVTRNKKDFIGAGVDVYDPSEFLELINT